MSLCHRGLDAKLTDTAVTVSVLAGEPLVALANALDWCGIAHLAIPDLKRTAKGCWYLGRRLSLRSHLAVMILQTLLKETDRGMEKRIRETPVLQVFCGASAAPLALPGPHQDRSAAQSSHPRDAPRRGRVCAAGGAQF